MATCDSSGQKINRYNGSEEASISKGDVDWHPRSWDLMQRWDGLQYDPSNLVDAGESNLAKPGKAYKQARRQTSIYEGDERKYLVRDEEIASSFEETAEGYKDVEYDLDPEDIPDDELDELDGLTKTDLSKLLGSAYGAVKGMEKRDERSTSHTGRNYEDETAKILGIPNHFELGQIDSSGCYTRGKLLEELENEAAKRKGVLTDMNLRERGRGDLRAASKNLFGSFNEAKDAADLETIEPGQGNRKFPEPEKADYFSEIDSSESAYWFGMLMADGCLSRDGYEVRLPQKLTDRHVVKQFRDALSIRNPIKVYSNNTEAIDGYEVDGCEPITVVAFSSKQTHNDLKKLGLGPNKSNNVKWPEEHLPKEYVSDFVRGLFDGDGSISMDERPSNRKYLTWNLAGNPPVLKEVGSRIQADVGPEMTQGKMDGVKDRRELSHSGNENVQDIASWMYQNVETGEDPFMPRKLSVLTENNKELQGRYESVLDQKEEELSDLEDFLEREKVEDRRPSIMTRKLKRSMNLVFECE